MQAPELYNKLAPFSLFSRKALSTTYRSLYITPESVRGCANFGIMEVRANLDLGAPVFVDTEMFLQVLRSLPKQELELSIKETSLHWKCGGARGQIATLNPDIDMPEIHMEDAPSTEMPDTFAESLALGGLSCGSTGLQSVGMHGITLDNTGDMLAAYATDGTTMSACNLAPRLPDSVDKATLSPYAAAFLEFIAKHNKVKLWFDSTTIYGETADGQFILKQFPPLKHNIRERAATLSKNELKIELNKEIILSFLKRAEALAEAKGKINVSVSVENKATRLSFVEGRAMSEDFYVVEDGPDITVPPIFVDGKKVAKALAAARHIVFDYASDNILILRGANDFSFIVAGRSGNQPTQE